jgi:hypothetical protein
MYRALLTSCACMQAALDSKSIALAKQGEKNSLYRSGKVTLSVSNNKTVHTNLIIYQCSSKSTFVHQESQVNKKNFVEKGL